MHPAVYGIVPLLAAGMLAIQMEPPKKADSYSAQSSIDVLLGRHQRREFARTLAAKRIAGRSYSWSDYAAWGRELLIHGRVAKPPTGPAPSPPLSTKYACVHCHNLRREDLTLTQPDPEARAARIRNEDPGDLARRDGVVLSLATGTTLWGAVNRERFYNGTYERYHHVKLADGRRMNVESLADAIQACGRYCSVGRFLDAWELDAVIAQLWELELTLADVDLSPEDRAAVLAQLNGGKPGEVRGARDRIKGAYLRAAPANRETPPVVSDGDVDTYADGQRVTGDAGRGQWLYQSACAGCHGTTVNPLKGAALIPSDGQFHRFVWQGTESSAHYMPFFPRERLSRQQAADVRTYLRSLK